MEELPFRRLAIGGAAILEDEGKPLCIKTFRREALVSSLAFTVWDRQCREDSEQKDQQMNYNGAPATPGLFKIVGLKVMLMKSS